MNTDKSKKVLVVDDSAFMRKLISDFLSEHPLLEVVGTARNGKEAVEKAIVLKPDVITMDVEMPVMDGLQALQEIMSLHPIPVVMLSSTTKSGEENTILAMEYGAIDFITKPGGAISLNLHEVRAEIIEKVLTAADVRMSTVARRPTKKIETPRPLLKPINPVKIADKETIQPKIEKPMQQFVPKSTNIHSKSGQTFVILGTSTGGPRALQEVLIHLPSTIQAPILIVQHMPAGFTKSLADRLNGLCEIGVKEAEQGELIENGVAYIAPGGKHLKLAKRGNTYIVELDTVEPPRMGHRPSVDVLFESAAEQSELNYVAVVMTGMGHDGKIGTDLLKKRGRTATIAESEKTSVVYGMPKAIKEAGLADEVVDLQDIASSILKIIKY